ncbi:MAG TPA: DUF6084 family protein [Lacipirellulaceae bacterium]|jgi:hypothetical protein
MSDLTFTLEAAETVEFAATPQLVFRLRISQNVAADVQQIQSILLRCQIRIEPTGRRYNARAHEPLHDLFGQPERWSQTMRTMLWQHTNVVVPAFTDSVVVDLPVPCSYDFNIAATKYFDALEDGEVPLRLLFSGTIFHETSDGALQIAQVPWEKEATFRLPVQTWRKMMDHYYPNSAWLRVRRDVFDELTAFKRRAGIATLDKALSELLALAEQDPEVIGALK